MSAGYTAPPRPAHHTARLPRVPSHTGSYRLIGGRLWDGISDEVMSDAEILIEGERILYAGPQREDLEWSDGPTIDLQGACVLPGFIDTHLHLRISMETNPIAAIMQFESHGHFHAALTAKATLDAGITTARDLGGTDAGYRHAIADGSIVGPRLHLSVAVISPSGGHADFQFANGANPYASSSQSEFMKVVDTDDQMRIAVRELMRSEADVIKVCTTGGVSSPSDTPHDLGTSERQVAIAVEETGRRQGQPVTSHAQGTQGIIEAIKGGARSIEHGYEIDDEAIALMLERGTTLVPTLSSALRLPDPAKVPAFLYSKKVTWSAIARDHVTRAIAAGVKVALGTDSGICPHGTNLTELGHLVDLGMQPVEALKAGTINAAELMRLDEHIGTLEAGKLADIVITQRDPITEIHALADPQEIVAVIQSGVPKKDTAGLLAAIRG